jgi:hypothetical protein
VWSLVAVVLGADCRPTSFAQYWAWVDRFLPNFQRFHLIGWQLSVELYGHLETKHVLKLK